MTGSSIRSLQCIKIGSHRISYSVVRSPRKSSHLVVNPSGEVEARVPTDRSDESIRKFVHSRARWIIRQQDYFDSFRPRDPTRRYASGETIRYLGRQYRLRNEAFDVESVKLTGPYLIVRCSTPQDRSAVRQLVLSWYHCRASEMFERKLEGLLPKMAAFGISDPNVVIRWMSRRWGSCTPSGRITLNPLLVLAPVDCVEYVIAHELCHLKHANHSTAFFRLLATIIPDWERRRDRLERTGAYLSL
ncbi:MAG: M48 family metallopeptidase [Phycisphaerales bacterium JB052]